MIDLLEDITKDITNKEERLRIAVIQTEDNPNRLRTVLCSKSEDDLLAAVMVVVDRFADSVGVSTSDVIKTLDNINQARFLTEGDE